MALPALGVIAKGVNALGLASIASKALPKVRGFVAGVAPKIRNALPQNVATVLGIGGGAAGGFGIASVFDRLGIEDERFQKLTIAALVVGAIFAVGQLFNFDVQL